MKDKIVKRRKGKEEGKLGIYDEFLWLYIFGGKKVAVSDTDMKNRDLCIQNIKALYAKVVKHVVDSRGRQQANVLIVADPNNGWATNKMIQDAVNLQKKKQSSINVFTESAFIEAFEDLKEQAEYDKERFLELVAKVRELKITKKVMEELSDLYDRYGKTFIESDVDAKLVDLYVEMETSGTLALYNMYK
jgi:hypothetical protein